VERSSIEESKMKTIACISDTHQHHKKLIMVESDIIIHAGDFTYHGERNETLKFLDWYATLPQKDKLLVCGNHEKWISKHPAILDTWCRDRNITLLRNETVEVQGLKIFGSPYSVEFGDWAYGLPDDQLAQIWNMIEPDVDVVVTHGPAYVYLDKCMDGRRVGSRTLGDKLETIANLKLHVCGHIHESRGIQEGRFKTVNDANCGIPYSIVSLVPFVVEM